MRYRLRSGLFLENVFGKYLLIADEKARNYCTWLTELDPTGAKIIKGIMAGVSCEEMATWFTDTYIGSCQEIQGSIDDFLMQMYKEQYLLLSE